MAEHRRHNNHTMGVLFIDNSNIFIEGKKLHARKLNLKTEEDPCFRIDIGKLCNVVLRGKKMTYGKLYGSEPPAIDTVWQKIRDAGLDVDTFVRNKKGKEKEVDTTLVMDATEYACEHKSEKSNTTIIILAGDRDYNKLIHMLLDKEWNVEVAAFSKSLSGSIKKTERESSGLKIIEIDTLPLTSFSFVNRKWNTRKTDDSRRTFPKDLTVAFLFQQEFVLNSVPDKTNLKNFANEITRIIKLPCRYYCHEESKQQSRTVLIVFDKICSSKFQYETFKTYRGEIEQACMEMFAKYKYDKFQSAVDYLQEKRQPSDVQLPRLLRWFSTDNEDGTECTKDELADLDYGNTGGKQSADMFSPSGKLDGASGFQQLDSSIPEHMESSENEGDTFQVVKGRETRSKMKTSLSCKFEFNCKYMRMNCCDKKHTEKEKEFFKFSQENNLNIGNRYKQLPCHGIFKLKNCRTGMSPISHRCYYYHSLKEARCYICSKVGEIGHHETQECKDKME